MNQANRKKLKLMVVDDEPDNLDLLYRTFRRDYKVYRADGAMSALETLDREGEMALIISDQRMPMMNGTELLSKTVERFPETIRILLTGYTDVDDLVEAINSGKVFKYITKPWNPEELKITVQQASETYLLLKKRTQELRRALRREELFNAITSAIRESLDYQNTLQTIIDALGTNFEAQLGVLHAVENHELAPESFFYLQGEGNENLAAVDDSLAAMQQVLDLPPGEKYLLNSTDSVAPLIVPLTYKQEHLAVVALYPQSADKPWEDSDVQLLIAVAEQAALAVSQAKLYQRTQQQAQKMQAELDVARQIQTNLLRQSLPEVEGVRIQAICHAAREVGGDFFEVYHHPGGDVWLAVGDVSGKGVPAALFMASGISILRRELAQEVSPDPEVVMQNLNRIMSEDLFSTNCFITLLLGRYTPATRQMAYTNAGHIYPMVWSHRNFSKGNKTEVNYLKARGIPVGILPSWKGTSGALKLKPGDIFLLTSDGITEASVTQPLPNLPLNPSAEGNIPMLGQEGLWELIQMQPSPFDLNHLLTTVREHTNKIQEDDQTMLHLEVL
jgi:serine phosphatase RsbU (regulator of sigma subunit)/FixJ family two-component response regulator